MAEASDKTPSGGMTEGQIRDKGWAIDVPFESAGPGELRYSNDGDAEEWIPEPGWDDGNPGIDPKLAEDLGVPEMSSGQEPDRSPGTAQADQQPPLTDDQLGKRKLGAAGGSNSDGDTGGAA